MADRAGSSAVEVEPGWRRDLAACFIGLFHTVSDIVPRIPLVNDSRAGYTLDLRQRYFYTSDYCQ